MSGLISIGEICSPFGKRGVVKVRPLTDFPERFAGMNEVLVQIGDDLQLYEMKSMNEHGEWLLMKFNGVDTREQASALTTGILKVAEADTFPLPEGCFYIFQLEGLRVYDGQRGFLGVIVDVLQTGANDVYVVSGGSFGEVLIPVIKGVVGDIDFEEGTVRVNLLPGLLDEGEGSHAD
jgi:16S rRNA processing protein RimM